MTLESTLQTALLLALPARLPDVRFFRRNVGAAKMHGVAVVKFGIKGQCDLYGITRGGTMHLEVELKNVGEKLNPDQKAWAAWCTEWKVPHIVLTAAKGETVEETVERWVRELERLIS